MTTPKDALILFSHGSLLCGAGEALETHAGQLRRLGEFEPVEIGYMNYSEPTFAEAVARCREQGARRIVVVPFFLVPGYFVSKNLPEHVDAARAAFPDLTLVAAGAIGFDTGLADALIESARDPLPPDQWRGDLTAAARGCRAHPDCPLYGTPDCPRVPARETPVRPFVE